jgi:hypothetical protein
MCLLIARKSGSWKPTKKEFSNAWDSNPDGFGIAYSSKGRISTIKCLTEKTAWKQIEKLPDNVPALLHWRMGTHGSVSLNNVHPFDLPAVKDSRRWVGAHNGVLSLLATDTDRTDSETYFRTLRRINIPEIEKDISKLGYGKMAFLSSSGDLFLANEQQGSWRNSDVWQSNDGLDDRFLYCGFGKSWKPSSPVESFLTPIDCCNCGDRSVSFRDGFDFYCETCASFPEAWR